MATEISKSCRSPLNRRKTYGHQNDLSRQPLVSVRHWKEETDQKSPKHLESEEELSDTGEEQQSGHVQVKSGHRRSTSVGKRLNDRLTDCKKQGSSSENLFIYGLVVGIILVPIVLGGVAYHARVQHHPEAVMQKFISNFQSLQKQFPSQESEAMKTIRVAVKSILKNKPPRPAVIILLPMDKTAETTTICLSRTLATVIEKSHGNLQGIGFLDGTELANVNPTECKHKLDDSVNDTFSTHGRRVIVVDHLEHLPADCILAFHGFCDDTNAPYKNVVYIFILHLTETQRTREIPVTDPWSKSLSLDKRSALNSRIGANVAFIKPENHNSCGESLGIADASHDH